MMKKLILVILPLIIIGCTGQGAVEFGLNDALLDGAFGDIVMTVTKIELPEGDGYYTVWEGDQDVVVHDDEFVSITDRYVEVTPGAYQNARLTVDNVRYVQNLISIPLIDTPYQFTASAFSELVVEENDDLQFVVNIVSSTWFDSDSLKIRSGYQAFQGAVLRIYY
jgi:hypothetical protein